MKYFKEKFEKILDYEIIYTKDIIGSYMMYNYSLKQKDLIATLKISENIVHIELLIFPEEMRRKGYGKQFVNKIKEWAYQNDLQLIELFAIQDSKEFWKKQGFTLIKDNNNKMVFYL